MNFKTKLFTNKSTVLWRRYKHFVVEGGKKKKKDCPSLAFLCLGKD